MPVISSFEYDLHSLNGLVSQPYLKANTLTFSACSKLPSIEDKLEKQDLNIDDLFKFFAFIKQTDPRVYISHYQGLEKLFLPIKLLENELSIDNVAIFVNCYKHLKADAVNYFSKHMFFDVKSTNRFIVLFNAIFAKLWSYAEMVYDKTLIFYQLNNSLRDSKERSVVNFMLALPTYCSDLNMPTPCISNLVMIRNSTWSLVISDLLTASSLRGYKYDMLTSELNGIGYLSIEKDRVLVSLHAKKVPSVYKVSDQALEDLLLA